jgi:ParB family chromosome partitioning protein
MADPKRSALGKGLSALIPDTPEPQTGVTELDVDLLRPNEYQPRVRVDDARLEELAQSIRAHGVIQPIVVRRFGETYAIIAGERRWRAAQLAGLRRVPVVVREVQS